MSTAVRFTNRCRLKQNLRGDYYAIRSWNLYRQILPHYYRTCDKALHYELNTEILTDEFDDRLIVYTIRDVSRVKIKEIVPGMWKIKFPEGDYYVFEPLDLNMKDLMNHYDIYPSPRVLCDKETILDFYPV